MNSKEILEHLRRSKADGMLSYELHVLIDMMIIEHHSRLSLQSKLYLINNVPQLVLAIDDVTLDMIEEGIVYPPKYLGEQLSPLVVINQQINQCIANENLLKRLKY